MRIRGGTLLRLWAIALLILASNSAFAANWYVSTTGNNANNGSTPALAKASINAMVNSSNVGNGDIIYILSGDYTEQVVIGNKSVTLIGDGSGVVIKSPLHADMTPYTFGTALSWNGSGKLSSNTIRPVVFINATSSSVSVNIKNITIDGSTASMSEASTDMLVGLAYRFASGTVGGSGADKVTIKNFNATSTSTGLNNAFGAMILTRSGVTFSHVKVENYRNAGIAVVGENLSTASSVIANQPNPTIIDCEVEGKQINTISDSAMIQSGVLIANGARATIKRTLVWKNRTNEANSAANRFAYGIYLNDARTVLIGETTTNKANGNLITDNEIGIYVRINSTAVSASGYTIRQNTIAYNGNETPSGKIAAYGSAQAQFTTYGAIRFFHVPVTNQTLSVTNNAWGNSEAHFFFEANATSLDYTTTNYNSNRVAFWNQDKGDQITFSSPLSPLYSELLYVHEDNSPVSSASPSTTNGIGVNLGFGYYNFGQLNRAVYAAREQAGTGNTPEIYVQSNTTEDETAIITKSVRVYGDVGSDCGDQATIKLANNLNVPTIWVYGLNSGVASADALTRTPNGITFVNINIGGNDIQNNPSATTTTGPALLVTGATSGDNTPTAVQLQSCAIESEFDGSPLAISTDQDGSITARYAAAPVEIDARFTRRPENCDRLLVDNDVRDNRDDLTLSLVLLDDAINIGSGNCADLQNAINAASTSSPRTTIRITANMGPCVISANTIANVRIETIAPATLTITDFNLNNGGGSGGNIPVCGIEINNESSGVTVVNRVNVWPPACLNDAMNIVTDGATNLVVAANGNAFGTLSYTEQFNNFGTMTTNSDANNAVFVQKRFDLEGATAGTAGSGSRTAATVNFTGRFVVQDRLRHDGFVLGIADVPVVSGNVYSTNGSSFGDSPAQVEMKHSRLVADLTNYDFHVTQPFYGGNIEMAQQFINPNSGSRRMNFTNPLFGTFAGQNATIWKRVFVNGLDNRGTQTGIIRLSGSGNCGVSIADASSVLRNISTTNVVVVNLTDCIQTAIGRVVDCDNSNQHIEGVGTNAADGSGGTVDLLPIINGFNQNLEIAKQVVLNESANVTLGSGLLTLRRGADVTGTVGFFADSIFMTQCYPAHNGANPRMDQAMNIVGTGAGRRITLAGYGNTNGLGSGSDPRGVWQFQNININKDVDILGFYHSTSATNLSNCANVESTTRPAISSSRNADFETVIGTHNNSSYNFGGGYIFNVNDNTVGSSVSGIKFRNVVHGGAGATTIVRLGNNTGNFTFDNNIITGSGNNSLMAGMVHSWGTNNISTLKVNGNHLVIDQASFYQILSINDLDDTYGPSNITENVIDVTNGIIGNSMYFENVDNSSPTGLNIASNWVTGSTNAVQLSNTVGANGLDGITIQRNNFRNMFRGIVISNIANADIGSNNITIKENYINGNDRGLELNFAWTNVTVNRLFVNNNNLANNNMGIYAEAITDPNGPTTNMFDFRFNYWGSELGPVRGANVAENPLLAPSDSSRIIGHVPFNHTTGSSIAQHPGQPYGRWIVYPVAVTPNDATAGTCGWQYQTMQAAVLRVNGNGDQLLGMYNRIFDARNNSLPLAYPVTTGTRTGTDQIFVIAQSTYGPNTFGYNGTVESEGSGNYPITFFADPQPSVIRGINRPTIYTDESGSIRVTSDFPRGFVAKDFINHVSFGSGTYTGISFENNHPNIVDYNFFAATQPNPVSYTGIRYNSSSTADANNVQTFTNNRINLGQSPGWPGGLSITSAPTSFKGIDIVDRGPVGGNSVIISNNEISVGTASGTRSIGIDINATNINAFSQVHTNIIRHMAAGNADVSARSSKWGTGIYITRGTSFSIFSNDIAGGNSIGGKGHDGITLDRPNSFTINSNAIARFYNSMTQETGYSTNPMRGYGIKVFSTDGTGDLNSFSMGSNTIGWGTPGYGCASAALYIGGTNGTIVGNFNGNSVYGTVSTNTSSTSNSAAVQIATSVYPEQPAGGQFTMNSNNLGDWATSWHNVVDLAIGTTPNGNTRNSLANNLSVDVINNIFRTFDPSHTANVSQYCVADGRPFAGYNIRNIFGRTSTYWNFAGVSFPGRGQSFNNRFSHGSILTGERNLANYSVAMDRTADAQQLNPSSTTEPVRIWRIVNTPLSNARSTDSINTVEMRENYDMSSGAATYGVFNENLVFPDQRVLLLGAGNSFANSYVVPDGATAVGITSTGRENKDIRGGVTFWMTGSQLYGQIPGSSISGAANKGDIYLQGNNITSDANNVKFFYAGTQVTGLGFSAVLATDIKAGIDDADDNGAIPSGAMTQHRTGVFVRGNGTAFTKDNTPSNAVPGTTLINAYPNPANSDVTVSFIVPINGMVRIALYNALGQKVTDLREEYLNAANYTTSFNVSDLPSGTYHVRMSTEGIDAPLTTSVTVIK